MFDLGGTLMECKDMPSVWIDYYKIGFDSINEKYKLDLYVSSQSCGYRKPNKYALENIANFFDVDVKDLLFIGDEEKDKLAAENTGCKFKFIGDLICQK